MGYSGLSKVFRKAAQTVFGAVKGIPLSGTYYSVQAYTVNATSQTVSSTPTQYSISRLIVAEFSAELVDGVNIMPEDRKILIPAADLSFTPKAQDYLTYVDRAGNTSRRQTVIKSKIDPAEALWTLQVRP